MLPRIAQLRDTLPPAEQRVADRVLADPHELATLRLAALAQRAGVSDPTVVRFCRKVGLKGYDALRLAVTRYLASHPGEVHAGVRGDDPPDTIIRKVVGSSIQELQRVQQSLHPALLREAAEHLLRARRIVFAGVGASALVASDAHNKFFRLGLPTAAFTDGPTIAQAGAITSSGSVFVGISKTGESAPIIQGLNLAAAAGARTLAVTTAGSELAARADIVLHVDAMEDTTMFTPMGSRLAQLAALDALQVCTGVLGGRQTHAYLEASKRALRDGG